jgi:hypothetical protein
MVPKKITRSLRSPPKLGSLKNITPFVYAIMIAREANSIGPGNSNDHHNLMGKLRTYAYMG